MSLYSLCSNKSPTVMAQYKALLDAKADVNARCSPIQRDLSPQCCTL